MEAISEVERLAARLQRLEDRMAILDLIARYGPSVDSLSRDAVADMWADDGSYDFGGEPLRGAAEVSALVDLPTHRDYVRRGCVHAMGLPVVTVDGDRATAIGNSRVYIHDGSVWRVERASANHWDFIRTSQGWRVSNRTNRLVDGSDDARALLRGTVPAARGEAER